VGRRYMVAECPVCGQYFAAALSAKPSCPRCGARLNRQRLRVDVVGSWKEAARLVQRKQAGKSGEAYSDLGMLTKTERFERVLVSLGGGRVSVDDVVREAVRVGLEESWVLRRLDYMEREGMLVRRRGGVEFTHVCMGGE